MDSSKLTKQQFQAFGAAWLGWAFDGLDGFLYPLVALAFVSQLMGQPPTSPDVTQKSALIQAVFLAGWAVGGAVFGRIGDKIGRTRTLTLTILTYAVFTGLSSFAGNWWQLMILRFVAALGIGGEWAAGSALVSEILPAKHKAWASATLQTGYMVGVILAAQSVGWFVTTGQNVKWVFLVGVLPALLTLWIRKAVPETEEWHGARQQAHMPKVSELFAPGVAWTTVRTLIMTSICLTTVWAFLFYVPMLIQTSNEAKTMAKPEIGALVRNVVTILMLWNIVANYGATYLAKYIGVRKTFAIMLAGALASMLLGFGKPRSLDELRFWFNMTSIFALGIFAIFPLYIPPLFPVLLRTTGAGFCYNFGRFIAAGGTLAAAEITTRLGGAGPALWWIGTLYIPAILLAFFMPESEGAKVRTTASPPVAGEA